MSGKATDFLAAGPIVGMVLAAIALLILAMA